MYLLKKWETNGVLPQNKGTNVYLFSEVRDFSNVSTITNLSYLLKLINALPSLGSLIKQGNFLHSKEESISVIKICASTT